MVSTLYYWARSTLCFTLRLMTPKLLVPAGSSTRPCRQSSSWMPEGIRSVVDFDSYGWVRKAELAREGEAESAGFS